MMALALNDVGYLLTGVLGIPVVLILLLLGYIETFYAHSVNGQKVPKGSFWLLPWIGETLQALSVPPQEFFNRKTRK